MKSKDIIILLVSGFLLVIAWIVFNIYHNSVESTTPEEIRQEIIPITPNFDQPTIDKLNRRSKISPIYEIAPQSTPPESISVIPEITKSSEGSPSALTASPGGEIVP